MKNISDISLGDIFDVLPEIHSLHAPTTKAYELLEKLSQSIFMNSDFKSAEARECSAGGFGKIVFPYTKMGAVNSVDIFSSINELIIFAFYWVNRNRYSKVVDIGANLGLHTILMSRLGWNVRAFEPDPVHLELLKRNVTLNLLQSVDIVDAAVSDKSGTLDFVRVLGNTTSSHLAGSKEAPYGTLERIPVSVVDIKSIVPGIDFMKIDAEGHERTIIEAISVNEFDHMDIMLEVGTKKNADGIFNYLSKNGVNAFAQKIGWQIVRSCSDMPTSYKEGSLFISKKDSMPW